MAYSAFADSSQEPTSPELHEILGRSGARWDELVERIGAGYAPLAVNWGFGGAKWGWTLRLKQKKRTVLYMTPRERHFVVGIVLGEKAVKAARAAPLRDSVLTLIEEAPRYPEGRGVRIEVRTKKDLESVVRLAGVKMAN